MGVRVGEGMTSKGACVFSILTQDASEALNLIFQLSVLVLLTINTGLSFIYQSAPLEKISNGDTFWGLFIRSRHLLMLFATVVVVLMLDHTTIISFFVSI